MAYPTPIPFAALRVTVRIWEKTDKAEMLRKEAGVK
jgi:hypothetical protein